MNLTESECRIITAVHRYRRQEQLRRARPDNTTSRGPLQICSGPEPALRKVCFNEASNSLARYRVDRRLRQQL
jgi:hypothetical protein